MFEEGQIQIHTENIFPIIKKAVYSDHEIFLRELVSNGIDAISKRRMASISGDCDECETEQILISIDRENKTLTVQDNGIGMTADEVKKYINQVAFSSAEEFLEKYKSSEDGIIGHFGLGFYSSFMVAKNVEILTKSALKNTKAVRWKCDGSPQFTLEEAEKDEVGTQIILYLLDEELEYIEPSRIKSLITKYCDFMNIDVQLEGESINKRNPAWRKNQNELTEQDYIELYRYLYPFQGDPLLWIHLKTDYPYNLQGILYFPKISGRADWEKGDIKLYSNQVFVSDSIKEVVPRYLLPLRGVLDSTDIPLNVSRSALQTDRKVRSIGGFVAKKVADRLRNIMNDKPEFYAEIWDSLAPFLKIGAMEDDKFSEQIKDLFIYETTQSGDDKINSEQQEYLKSGSKLYTTLNNYIERQPKSENTRILYCTDEISQASALNLWKSQGAEILKAETVIDTQFIPWLENKNPEIKFQRVDAELDKSLTDETGDIANQDGETQADVIRSIVKKALNNDNVTIQVQAIKGDQAPPAMILLPEQMRRINDISALMDQRLPGLPEHHVIVLNQSHRLVEALIKLNSGSVIVGTEQESESAGLAKELATHLYDLARLGVGGLEASEISNFQKRSAELLSGLLERSL